MNKVEKFNRLSLSNKIIFLAGWNPLPENAFETKHKEMLLKIAINQTKELEQFEDNAALLRSCIESLNVVVNDLESIV